MSYTISISQFNFRPNKSNIWIILKYLFLIHLYLSSHLITADALKEHGCDYATQTKCKNNDICIPKTFLCDGENDCEDFSDEMNCSDMEDNFTTGTIKSEECDKDSFLCLDGLCISNHWVCDGNKDCLDNSDETVGCNNTISCDDGFRCKSRSCIPKEWKCDGNDDCGDGSDEEDCPTFSPTTCNIHNKQFLCNDKIKCLKLEQVCNNVKECKDGTDEDGECLKPKNCQPACINGNQCIQTPSKSLCVCPSGYKDEMGSCIDVDECKEFGACDHKCTNTVGNHICECALGYHLKPDKKSCKADGGEGLLLFSSEHEIRGYYLESKAYYPISKVRGHASGVAYDGIFIYWTNIGERAEAIVRSNEYGSETEEIVNFGLGTAENLALDWITGNIYFTDSQMQHIGVCTSTGLWCMVLHKDGVDNPRAIALDPKRGTLYWSDWGENVHSIIKSGMDGSDRMDFVNTDIYWPNGITIDFGTDRLYWADSRKKRIESILLDGTDRRIIISEPIDHPYSISVYENTLYWSDWKGNQILSCNKFTGKNHSVVIKKHDSQIYNLYIFQSSIQTKLEMNPCLERRCSHICLLTPLNHQVTCACPQDMELTTDAKTCHLKHNYNAIYAASEHTVIEIKYDKIGKKHVDEYRLTNIGVLGDMVYDAISDSVLLSDLYYNRITSINRRTKLHSTIYEVDDKSVKIVRIDYDPIANNLYWIDALTNSLNVISMNTMVNLQLITNFGEDEISDLELVPELGVMFISLCNQKGHCHIDKYFMDGSSRYHLIEKDLIGPHITLSFDSHLHRLFYADQGSGQIISTSINVNDKHVFRQSLPGPIALAIHENYIFWANYGSDQIHWANKYSGLNFDFSTTTGKHEVAKMKLLSLETFVISNNTTCHINNGNCSHVCLLKEKSQVCACPLGMTLDRSGFKCIQIITCSKNQHICTSSECISKNLVCNGMEDCKSGDDEANCLITTESVGVKERHEVPCPLDNFFCLDNTGCLPQTSVCDSVNDCADSSDEKHCSYDKSCNEAQFSCGSGECISSSWRCDDRIDCMDESDEMNCNSNACDPITEFRCNSGNCIPASWRCDRELDCPDASDESTDCEYRNSCSSDMFKCSNHKCIDKKLKCNTINDCGDNSDEIECKSQALDLSDNPESIHKNIILCNVTHFTCSGLSSQCIPLTARCNGTSECTYNEDEHDCNECLYGQFECTQVKECIPEVWECDGMADCADKSDEDESLCLNKQTHHDLSSLNETVGCAGMECADTKQCIPFYKVCDKIPDCNDHSDEMGLCGSGCDGAGCSQICRESPSGAQCDCNNGYKLSADGRTCIDINECSTHSTCSQLCHNSVGSFHCSCLPVYYQLRDDRRRCKATGKEMEFIYLTGKDIRMSTESFSTVHVLYEFKAPTIIDGMDINVKESSLYWTLRYENKIMKLSTNNPSKIDMKEGFNKVGCLAVDWITGNLYVSVEWNKIRLCNSIISLCTDIYKGPKDIKISAIVLDPLQGEMFWSETQEKVWGHWTTSLKKSKMTGRQVETILSEEASILAVSDLANDVVNKWIYFSDLLSKTIGRVSYNGSKHEILFMTMEAPSNIALFEDHIYLSIKSSQQSLSSKSSKYGVIQKCGIRFNLFGECNYISLLPASSKDVVKRLRISHQSLQIEEKNNCVRTSCQGLCVNSGGKAVCLCEEGKLAPTNGSCSNLIKTDLNEVIEMQPSSSSHIATIICLLLIMLTICGIIVAFKYSNLKIIPAEIYGRMGSKLKTIINFKLQRYDEKSFQFDNLKNELTEELIPEQEDGTNPLLREF